MVVQTYNSILAIEPGDRAALVALAASYEKLGRHTDVVKVLDQQAEHSADPAERVALYRKIAWIWLDRFNNVNNATKPLEQILAIDPRDADAIAQLKDLYGRRRAWRQLFEVSRREADMLEGARRRDAVVELARLAAEKLSSPAESIALWREALALDRDTPGALDALREAHRAREGLRRPRRRARAPRRGDRRRRRQGERADEARRGVRRAPGRPGAEHRHVAPRARGEARPLEGDARPARRVHGRRGVGHAGGALRRRGRLRGPRRRAQRERGAGGRRRGEGGAVVPRGAGVRRAPRAADARLPRLRARPRGGAEEPPRRLGARPDLPRRGEVAAPGATLRGAPRRRPRGGRARAALVPPQAPRAGGHAAQRPPGGLPLGAARLPDPPRRRRARAHAGAERGRRGGVARARRDARRARRRRGRPRRGRPPPGQGRRGGGRPAQPHRQGDRALPGRPRRRPRRRRRRLHARPAPPPRRPLGRPPRALRPPRGAHVRRRGAPLAPRRGGAHGGGAARRRRRGERALPAHPPGRPGRRGVPRGPLAALRGSRPLGGARGAPRAAP